MIETMIVVFRDDDVLESQFLSLSNTLLDTAHRTDFTAQTYLARHTPALLDRRVNITAQYGCQHTQVHGWIGYSQSSGNIQEHVFLLIWCNMNLLVHVYATISTAKEAHIIEGIVLKIRHTTRDDIDVVTDGQLAETITEPFLICGYIWERVSMCGR